MENTSAFVPAANVAGLQFLEPAGPIRAESERLRKQGIKVQIVLLHEGSAVGQNAVDGTAAVPWEGPAVGIAQSLQDTTVDVILGGHTHRVTNTMVGHILVAQGMNAGISYSSVHLATTGGDVSWAGAATRAAKNLGVAPRPDVQAIVDEANAQLVSLRNQVIGTQAYDILRDPTRLNESAMGNMIADAMRTRYQGVVAALTDSGSLRANLYCAPPSAGEGACEITWGEMFSVLPFGYRTVVETLTYEQLTAALAHGLAPACGSGISTAQFPQVSGIKVQYSCSGNAAVIDSLVWETNGSPIGPGDTIRVVTNDYLFGGGEGYSMLADGTEVLNTDDALLDLAVGYVRQNSPVNPAVTGRIVLVP
jgi:2',3'-cyclic-nucleotide 2'-phosphodiesterase (5'-nucleotidase family)